MHCSCASQNILREQKSSSDSQTAGRSRNNPTADRAHSDHWGDHLGVSPDSPRCDDESYFGGGDGGGVGIAEFGEMERKRAPRPPTSKRTELVERVTVKLTLAPPTDVLLSWPLALTYVS